ncbi:TPA: retroviral-like aspartic protease [Candidatus Bathyarchaeota archaeon]|nr:retroviral-like aspartic protease [Candidatus Bathyarchaeota archaeon]
MRALKTVGIKFADKEVSCTALFDTGSGYTMIQRAFFEENFGTGWSKLPRAIKLYLINGEFIEADKYAQVTITIDGFELLPPEVVLIIDGFAKEIEVEGKKISLPRLIIGSGTMDKYGITLDPKEGVKLTEAALLL